MKKIKEKIYEGVLILLLVLVRMTIFILEIFSRIVSFAVEKVNILCDYILQKI